MRPSRAAQPGERQPGPVLDLGVPLVESLPSRRVFGTPGRPRERPGRGGWGGGGAPSAELLEELLALRRSLFDESNDLRFLPWRRPDMGEGLVTVVFSNFKGGSAKTGDPTVDPQKPRNRFRAFG